MKITLLGILSIVGVLVLLAYVGQQVERKRSTAKGKDEQARDNCKDNPGPTDTV